MRTTSSYSDYQPIGHIGRLPIHVTTLLAALYFVGMIVTTMLDSARISLDPLLLDADAFFRHGHVWQPLTCTFINGASFFFLFGIMFFYSPGIEVERYLGRVRFVKFYALTLLVPVLVLGAWRLLGFNAGFGGMILITVAMFIAFATLYPNMEYWGWVPLKYVAFACFAISGLSYFPRRDWFGLSELLAESAAGFGYVRHLQSGGSVEFGDLWERINPFKRRPKLRVLPSPAARGRSDAGDDVDSIDPLLDKIARSGMASLTAKERARLESARAALLNKDRR